RGQCLTVNNQRPAIMAGTVIPRSIQRRCEMEETVIRFVCLVATQDGALGWDGLREWYQWSGSAVGLQHAAWYTGRCAILDTERRGTHSVLCVTRPRISK